MDRIEREHEVVPRNILTILCSLPPSLSPAFLSKSFYERLQEVQAYLRMTVADCDYKHSLGLDMNKN